MSLDELKAELEREQALLAKSALSDEQAEHAKLLIALAETKAERQASQKAQRVLRRAELEADARKAAAGRYLVKAFDLAALLPDVEQEKLPGGGVLVLRSPPITPIDALAQFYREAEAHERPLPDIYVDLVCASVVFPDVAQRETGMSFRDFFESSIGRGTALTVGDAVTELGGARAKRTKRGRG
jgi:hypothetical protein